MNQRLKAASHNSGSHPGVAPALYSTPADVAYAVGADDARFGYARCCLRRADQEHAAHRQGAPNMVKKSLR
jgi:hypothetical protein